MGISPLVMNGMVGRTQDYSTIKQNEDNKILVDNANMHTQIERKTEKNISTVREQDDTNQTGEAFDAREQGNGTYAGDGGRQRKKKPEDKDGKVILKNHEGFDIKI